MKHEVFICYDNEDKVIADAICTFFEARNIRCWYPSRDIEADADKETCIRTAMEATELVVFVYSDAANRSEDTLAQIELAVQNNKTIIPFVMTSTEPDGALGYYLKPLHWLDALNQELEDAIIELSDRCARCINAERPIEDPKRIRTSTNNSAIKNDDAVFYKDYKFSWLAYAAILAFLGIFVYLASKSTAMDFVQYYQTATDESLFSSAYLFSGFYLAILLEIVVVLGIVYLVIGRIRRKGTRESFSEYALKNRILKCGGACFLIAFFVILCIGLLWQFLSMIGFSLNNEYYSSLGTEYYLYF